MGKTYVLLKPGQDPIEDYPTAGKAPRSIAMRWSGPFVLAVILGAGALCSRTVSAAPTPEPPVLAVLPTVTPSETATPYPTSTATETQGVTPVTPTPTDTATPTASPTITTTPTATLPHYIQGVVTGARELNARFGPGPEYLSVLRLAEGQTVTLVGRDRGATWGQIEVSPGAYLWARMSYIVTDGNESIARLPIVDAPPR